VWFSGVPHAFSANPLLLPILKAPSESFATDSNDDNDADIMVDATEKGGEGLWAGQSLGVVSGFQTKENSRVLWAGGVELFSNKFMKKDVSKYIIFSVLPEVMLIFSRGVMSGNRQFARDVSAWTFQESFVLRIDSTSHHHLNETSPRTRYTTNDMLVGPGFFQIPHFNRNLRSLPPEFPALIQKHRHGSHIPDSAIFNLNLPCSTLISGSPSRLFPIRLESIPSHSVHQIGMEFLSLSSITNEKGLFCIPFMIPLFNICISWTYLHSSTTVSIVPPRHDGYPRFITAAWPYYAGAMSTSLGFVLFCGLWLAGNPTELRGKGKGGKGKVE
jgi:oligosaccharyltransferase complex subunit beta